MALPTNDHPVLCDWLASHRVFAAEVAGRLIIGDLDALLAVAGSGRRLTAAQREAVAAGRSAARDPSPSSGLLDPDLVDQQADVFEVLEDVCEALAVEGVTAAPFEGLGVSFGDEVLDAKVLVADLTALYGRMALTAPGGEGR